MVGMRVFVLAGAAGGLLARGHVVYGCLLAVVATVNLWRMIRRQDKDHRDPGPPSFPGTA
jgi:hypothetical protein